MCFIILPFTIGLQTVLRQIALLLILVISACSVKPYRLDIPQGNVVTADMVARLKPGMTRSQVRFVLGSPLLTDPFHDSRWDYVHRLVKEGVPTEEKKFTVYFDGDKLLRWEGDVMPADKPVTPLPAEAASQTNATPAAAAAAAKTPPVTTQPIPAPTVPVLAVPAPAASTPASAASATPKQTQ